DWDPEYLLSSLHTREASAERTGPCRRFCSGGRLGDGSRQFQARRASRDTSYVRDDNVRGHLEMDQIVERPPSEVEPVEQRGPLGVQASNPVLERKGVPLERGSHCLRLKGRGCGRERPDSLDLQGNNGRLSRAPRSARKKVRQGKVRW